MILADFECQSCGTVAEHFVDSATKEAECPHCVGNAKRIISFGRTMGSQESAPWIRSVLDVVDKTSTKPHVQEFVKNPSRETYKKWMKGEGIRPVDYTEHGGPPQWQRPAEPDVKAIADRLYQRHRDRQRIEI